LQTLSRAPEVTPRMRGVSLNILLRMFDATNNWSQWMPRVQIHASRGEAHDLDVQRRGQPSLNRHRNGGRDGLMPK